MDTLQSIALYSQSFIEWAWLPILIWTVIAGVVLAILNSSKRIHLQYHYHARLALIAALPFGMLATYSLEKLSGMIFSGQAAASNLKFVTVMAPIEVGATQSESLFSVWEIASILLVTLLAAGTLYLLGKQLYQYAMLSQIKRTVGLRDLLSIDDISPKNYRLITSFKRPVKFAFIQSDIIPVTFGWFNPIVLMPASLKKDPEKLNLALRHELTHIKHHDFLTHIGVTLTRALFWFHPLVHRLAHKVTDYREMRVDSVMVTDPDISNRKYASLLLELLPMPNLNKDLSVNMAQESSNLKKRIQMMTDKQTQQPISGRSTFAILGAILLSTAIAMACTDMQTHNQAFDEEELDLMTDFDPSGDRDYQQLLIYMSDSEQAEKYDDALAQMRQMQPEYIQSINVLEGENAVDEYGSRAANGVISVRTQSDTESFNRVLTALGMEPISPPSEPSESGQKAEDEDYFVVVEDMPELIGGLASIQSEIEYPETAKRAGIEGRVYIQFIVNEEGQVEDPRVIRGIGGGADEAALEAVKKAEFNPGLQRGEPVRVQYSLPVVFRLPDSDGDDS